ncbi:MAG: hypothetical protein WCY99_03075, partial [Candidatus Neomarinimicrobiota bacterium]
APEDKPCDTAVHIGGQWFLAYRGNIPSSGDNAFGLKRGYLTFKKNFNESFSVRYTQDITIDREGEDAGNVEIRFKYCYLKAGLPDFLFFKQPYVELGLVHQPWIEYEQKINTYRVQGPMFLDKFGVTSSADFGINLVSLIGPELDEEAKKKVDSEMPGRYGSISLGIYNGGGYSALEMNNNKTLEGRLTLRPLPGFMPGLQFSYGFATGRGNDTLNSKFNYNVFMISHETAKTTFTAQHYSGTGFHGGGAEGINYGFSFFGELCVPFTPFTLFGRFDSFRDNVCNLYSSLTFNGDEIHTKTYIAGLAWVFYKKNRLILDLEKRREAVIPSPLSSMSPTYSDEITAELALEIVF